MQLTQTAAVRTDLDDAETARWAQRSCQLSPRASEDVRRSGGSAQGRQVDPVRSAEDPLERRRVLGRTLLQQGEDATAVIIEHNDRQVGSWLLRPDDQPRPVVQEREVAKQRV